jgi:MarR family transcriptional regulator, organic hydroperoxide resistance regulator
MLRGPDAIMTRPRPHRNRPSPSRVRAAAKPTKALVYDLGGALPYLLARAGSRMGLAFTQELKPFGLTLTEWRVCVALHYQDHQRLSDLATHTSTDASTLSRIVDGLIRRDLVLRERAPSDARALSLVLSPAGVALTERIIPLAQLYERVALVGIEPEDAALLRRLLARVYDNIATLER